MRLAIGAYLFLHYMTWTVSQILLIVDSMKTGNDYWTKEKS